MDEPAFRQSFTVDHRVPLHLLCKPSGAIAFSSACVAARLCHPSPHNVDQVVDRMVDFVVKGQQLGRRWLNLSSRIGIASVTVLNATNSLFRCYASLDCLPASFLKSASDALSRGLTLHATA